MGWRERNKEEKARLAHWCERHVYNVWVESEETGAQEGDCRGIDDSTNNQEE